MWILDSKTHQLIVSKALLKCRSSFRNLLETHQELFILGAEAPDLWQNSQEIICDCLTQAAQNIANIYLSFEEATVILQNHKRYCRILNRVRDATNSNNRYRLKKYKPALYLYKYRG
jgi:hypothetical protein